MGEGLEVSRCLQEFRQDGGGRSPYVAVLARVCAFGNQGLMGLRDQLCDF
jgi:hypothetical protein